MEPPTLAGLGGFLLYKVYFMKRIPLSQGKFALVDDEDFEELKKYRWYATCPKNIFYAYRSFILNGNRVKRSMHCKIIHKVDGLIIDHIDGDGLNNQRSNLRLCTNAENQRNSKKFRNNTTGYRGVYKMKHSNRFESKICVDGKRIYLGGFSTKEEAYKAFCDAAKTYHKEFASTRL